MVKSTHYSSRGPDFKFQQLLGGSQPSIMESGTLFWHVDHVDRALIYTKLIKDKNGKD